LGPAFTQVAIKYKGDPGAPDRLAKKIVSGGSGNWGDAMMPAHPTLADGDAKAIVAYILSLAYPHAAKSLPVAGTYTTSVPEGSNPDGSFILRAAYTDRGNKTVGPQTGEQVLILRAPILPVAKATEAHDIAFNRDSTITTVKADGAWLKFNKVDLTDIKQMEFIGPGRNNAANGTIEVHKGSPQGNIIGTFSGSFASKNIMVVLLGTLGINDLYIVFNGTPLRLSAIKFSNGE